MSWGVGFWLGQQECFADLLVTQLQHLTVVHLHALQKKHYDPFQRGHGVFLLCVLTYHEKTKVGSVDWMVVSEVNIEHSTVGQKVRF